MLACDVEVDLGLFQNILDGDVLMVSLDGKLFLDVTPLGNRIKVRLLKQVPTREFSFVKLNWISVIRFHLWCGTH